ALRPGRPLAPAAARHRRRPLQRDGAADPRRGAREPRVRRRADGGLRGLAGVTGGRDPRARGGADRRARPRHRARRALVRAPAEPGLTVTDMVEAWLDGRIRAMYVVGENPLLSEPDLHHAEKALAQLDLIVVQDLFLHETAEHAHVFLPAAAFAEKEGTFTNS